MQKWEHTGDLPRRQKSKQCSNGLLPVNYSFLVKQQMFQGSCKQFSRIVSFYQLPYCVLLSSIRGHKWNRTRNVWGLQLRLISLSNKVPQSEECFEGHIQVSQHYSPESFQRNLCNTALDKLFIPFGWKGRPGAALNE